MIRALALVLAALLAFPAYTAPRSHSAKAEFKWTHPCPPTGRRSGSCAGYVIDHVVPLACGGADAPANMQWQTEADAKIKDRWERKACGSRSR